MKHPCSKECEFRSAECRLNCPEWLEYVKQRNMEYQTRQQERDIERNYQSHVADAIKRFKRGTHKRR